MRGKREVRTTPRVTLRITPADAGKTGMKDSIITLLEDHPRGCGENITQIMYLINCQGSPPRMRGKPKSTQYKLVSYRITPADAGKTYMVKIGGRNEQDHPRGCGENTKKIL